MKRPGDIVEARALQLELSRRVRLERALSFTPPPRYVAGADCAYAPSEAAAGRTRRRAGAAMVVAAACLFRFPEAEPLEDAFVIKEVDFPYIPGLLGFREGPALIEAVSSLKHRPEVVIIDGQGTAHPRGIGVASHVGVELEVPTIGCAKSRLVGEFKEPALTKGSHTALVYKGGRVGSVVRTRTGVRPVFVSLGHLIDVESAVEVVLSTTTRYRLPEPIRRADRLAAEVSRTL